MFPFTELHYYCLVFPDYLKVEKAVYVLADFWLSINKNETKSEEAEKRKWLKIWWKSLFEFIDSLFNDILIKSNSAQQAKLFELKFYAALYIGSQSQIQNVLSQIQKESNGWNMKMFEIWFGEFDLWFQEIKKKGNKRSLILKQVEDNKLDNKIKGLKSSDLIL